MSGTALPRPAPDEGDILACLKGRRPDWSAFTTRLGKHYGGICSLVFHDFAVPGFGLLINNSATLPEVEVHNYSLISTQNPLLQFIQNRSPGSPESVFAGSDANTNASSAINPPDRTQGFSPDFWEWMVRLKTFRGMIAVLFWGPLKDRKPTLTVSLAVLRNEEFGIFDDADKDYVRSIYSKLVEIVHFHPLLNTWGAYRDIIGLRSPIPFEPLAPRLDKAIRAYRERLLATGRPEHIVNHDIALLQMSLVEAEVESAPHALEPSGSQSLQANVSLPISSALEPLESSPDLPTCRQKDWTNPKHRGDLNAAAFVRENYAKWLGKGLTRAHIARLDRPLHAALKTWLRRHPEDKLDLPVKREVTDKLAKAAFAEVRETSIAIPQSEDERLEMLRRVGNTLSKRDQRLRSVKDR